MATRRDFLRTIVLGSGAVYVGGALGCGENTSRRTPHVWNGSDIELKDIHRNSQFHSTAHSILRDGHALPSHIDQQLECDVVVVGGGPSGLSATYALTKLGYSVILVENESRPGGAAVYCSFRGLHFPLASIYFVDNNAHIQELCEFAGVKPTSAPEDAVVLGGQSYYDYWKDSVLTTLPISDADKTALKRFRDDILSIEEPPEYPLPETLSPAHAILDTMSAREYCSRYNSDFLTQFISLYTRSSMGGSIDETNAYALLNFYTGEIAKTSSSTRFTFEGGLGGFIRQLGSGLKTSQTLLEHCCVKIVNTRNAVQAQCVSRDGKLTRVTAKHAVLAVPKFQVPRLIDDLPEAQRAAMRGFSYSPMLTVHLCSDKKILDGRGFDTWYPEAGDLYTDIIDPSSIEQHRKDEAFVASVYCPLPLSSRSMLLDDPQIVQYARQVGESVLRLTDTKDVESVKEIYTYAWGHSMVVAKRGSHNGPAQTARRSFRRTHFANTDNDSVSAFENAIASGFSVAEKIDDVMKHTS